MACKIPGSTYMPGISPSFCICPMVGEDGYGVSVLLTTRQTFSLHFLRALTASSWVQLSRMKSPAPGKFFTATSRSPTEIRPSQAAAPPSITCQTHCEWSLTQFYYFDFSKSIICGKKCIFNKRTIKVASVVVDGVLGPLSLARPGTPDNVLVSLQFRKQRTRRRRGSCWEELKRIVFSDEGSLICPTGKSMSFNKKETEKN